MQSYAAALILTSGVILSMGSLIETSPPWGPIFMPNDHDTFEMIGNCIKAYVKFTKIFSDYNVKLLGVTDLEYLLKKCRFSFTFDCLNLNVSRIIDISANNILKLSKNDILHMLMK